LQPANNQINESRLSLDHITGLGSLGTLRDVEFDIIAFGQRLKPLALDSGKMDEYILSTVLLDKTKALGVVEPLHSAFCQLFSPPFYTENAVQKTHTKKARIGTSDPCPIVFFRSIAQETETITAILKKNILLLSAKVKLLLIGSRNNCKNVDCLIAGLFAIVHHDQRSKAMFKGIWLLWFGLVIAATASAQGQFEIDTLATSSGHLTITFIGHGTLMFTCGGKVIHIDPWSNLADYSTLPKADIILVTHEHRDHLDPDVIEMLRTDSTALVLTEPCAEKITGGMIMKNGDVDTVQGIPMEAVPAYNIVHKRESGQPFHPQGVGNGYIITFGDLRVYVAGDTENTPEIKALQDIDVAFLPMNLPYTMTPEMVADAARAFRPKVLYPYHYGDTDTEELVELLKDVPEIEVRIRQMQ
jgi:L-ascorbate metabolism protein UlaG (beta-lactamase superfamily)